MDLGSRGYPREHTIIITNPMYSRLSGAENAIEAMFLILLVYNLFYSYVYRHVKTYRLYGLTIKQIVEEMLSSYISQKWRMSYVTFDG